MPIEAKIELSPSHIVLKSQILGLVLRDMPQLQTKIGTKKACLRGDGGKGTFSFRFFISYYEYPWFVRSNYNSSPNVTDHANCQAEISQLLKKIHYLEKQLGIQIVAKQKLNKLSKLTVFYKPKNFPQ